jgi:hypothetical protein
MSAFSIMSEAGVGSVLVAKWTLLLALAWLAHAALAGRNPRWRVALWRGAMLGVGLTAAMALIPPIVRVPVAPAPQPAFAESHEPIASQHGFEPAPRTIIVTAFEPPRSPRSEPGPSLAPTSRPAEAVAPSMPIPSPASLRPAESWLPYATRLADSWVAWIRRARGPQSAMPGNCGATGLSWRGPRPALDGRCDALPCGRGAAGAATAIA